MSPLGDRHAFLDARRGPVTAVASFRATAEERRRAYSRIETERIVRALGAEARFGDRPPLLSLAATLGEGASPRHLDARVLLERTLAAVETERLLVLPGWDWMGDGEWRAPPTPVLFPCEPAVTPSQVRAAARKSFELVILDVGSGRPLANVPLEVITPEGEAKRVSSDGAGRVKLPQLSPGSCAVSSLIDGARVESAYAPCRAPRAVATPAAAAPPGPGHLVEVARHRIRTGETPASIAAAHGVPWERIAHFNWGTSLPAALEEHYRDTLGCLRKRPDGRYRFDDGDEPGVILIPRPFEASLAVGPVHELHVAGLRPLFVSLENEARLPIPAATYRVRFGDGSERSGTLGKSGIARLDGVPDGPFAVSYPDELDLHAKSLAVSVRRAFDEAALAPLFTLLMQSPAIVARATAAYDRHLNDLTGRGLGADIDQVATDPEARRPLLALCQLAGLAVGTTENAEATSRQRSTS